MRLSEFSKSLIAAIPGLTPASMFLKKPFVMPTLPHVYTDAEIAERFPFYWHLVPKTERENLLFRREILRMAQEDDEFAKKLDRMCELDELFWINTFAWTFSPKDHDENRERPMVLWWSQVQFIISLADQNEDMLVEKSREEGVTWGVSCDYTWRFLYKRRESILCASIDEEMVDTQDNEDCLFSKIDFLLEHCPFWMCVPHYIKGAASDYRRVKMTFGHRRTYTKINGAATTDNLGRGGRRSRAFFDEWPTVRGAEQVRTSTQYVTKRRLFTGTPLHPQDNNDQLRASGHIKLIELHWSANPRKSVGLYKPAPGGKIEYLDTEYWTPERIASYQFKKEIPLNPAYPYRSPWYDTEEDREPDRSLFAREVDIYRDASSKCLFYPPKVRELQSVYAQLPLIRGNVIEGHWTENPLGAVQLWVPISTLHDSVDAGKPVVSVDCSAGSGMSNTAFKIGDAKRGVIFGAVTDNRLGPVDAARLAVSICSWLDDCLLIYESGGSGSSFGDAVAELGYTNIYKVKGAKEGGVKMSRPRKRQLMDAYKYAVERKLCIQYDPIDFEEMLGWRLDDDGVDFDGHIQSEPENHGDRNIAAALFWWVAKDVVSIFSEADKPMSRRKKEAVSHKDIDDYLKREGLVSKDKGRYGRQGVSYTSSVFGRFRH